MGMKVKELRLKIDGPCGGVEVYIDRDGHGVGCADHIFVRQGEWPNQDLIMLSSESAPKLIEALNRVLEELAIEEDEIELQKQHWWAQQNEDEEYICEITQ
jgi:hypothetical protein